MAKKKAGGKKAAAAADKESKKKGKGKGKGKSKKNEKPEKEVAKPTKVKAPPEPPPPPPPPVDLKAEKEKKMTHPNQYPGLLESPQTMAVAGSECGTYDSICKLLRASLRFSDRALILTSWGSFAVFRVTMDEDKSYFLFDGCTCNINRFRYWDLKCGTAGLIYYDNLHDALAFIMESRENHQLWKRVPKIPIEEMCN